MGLGAAADRFAVRDLGRLRDDRRPELALEALDDHRRLGVAEGAQDLLARLASLDARRGLLLEHPLERGAHLVEVGLAQRLDGHDERRLGEGERRERERLLLGRERVARRGDGQLRDRADLAGLELADRLLLLAVQEEQLADALLVVATLVPDVALGVERAGQDAQEGQPADERVRRRLEHAREERAVGIRRDLDLRAALGERRDRAFVGRGGEVSDDRVEHGLQADAAVRAADEHGREDRFLDALPKARLELRVGDLLALEVLHEDVVVRLRRGLEELVAPARHLVGHPVGDRRLDLLASHRTCTPCDGPGRRSP